MKKQPELYKLKSLSSKFEYPNKIKSLYKHEKQKKLC